jgi:hypothetical protein
MPPGVSRFFVVAALPAKLSYDDAASVTSFCFAVL